MKNRVIVGICAFNHDSSACIIKDSELVAFAEEERFNGEKHSSRFPDKALGFCLNKAGIEGREITDIAFHFNPMRCLRSYIKNNNPLALTYKFSRFKNKRFFYEGAWLLDFMIKIKSIPKLIKNKSVRMHFVDHHDAHAWYGIFTSPSKNGIVLSNDSIGEDITAFALHFSYSENGRISLKSLLKQNDPHSVGYLYGAITEYLGFKRGDGEGKVMALASFGNKDYYPYFTERVKLLEKGQFILSPSLLVERSYQPKAQRLHDDFFKTFGNPKTSKEPFTDNHFKVAQSLQKITEDILRHQIVYLSQFSDTIILNGGVAQNSVANGILSNDFPNLHIFVPPIPHDAGCSLGAALKVHYDLMQKLPKQKETASLGPSFYNEEIIRLLQNNKISYEIQQNMSDLLVKELQSKKVVAVFRGPMEGGPRALGYRSILADPSSKETLDYLNLYVKYREAFRPYGGIIRADDVHDVFIYNNKIVHGDYMSFVYPVKEKWKKLIPALVHVDSTCRVQILGKDADSFLFNLLSKYKKVTGIPLLINTSFNIYGQPICRTPQDALNAFYNSGIDVLVFNDSICVRK